MNIITFPLSEEVFSNLDNINQDDYLVDVSKIDFGDDEDNIESSIIYMRNLQLHMPLDFSNIDYETKLKWLDTYLHFDMQVPIKELDETLLTILAQDDIHLKCIFTIDEIKNIHYDDIATFITSIFEISCILLNKADGNILEYTTDLEIVREKPYFFDTLIHIIKDYPKIIDALISFYMLKVNHKVYHYALEHISKHNEFYEAIMNIPTIKLLGWINKYESKE